MADNDLQLSLLTEEERQQQEFEKQAQAQAQAAMAPMTPKQQLRQQIPVTQTEPPKFSIFSEEEQRQQAVDSRNDQIALAFGRLYNKYDDLYIRGELGDNQRAAYNKMKSMRESYAKDDIVKYILGLDADNISSEKAEALSNMYARKIDMGNSEFANISTLTGEQAFPDLEEPIDRIKYIQEKHGQIDPDNPLNYFKDVADFDKLPFDKQLKQAKEHMRMFFGLLPPKESFQLKNFSVRLTPTIITPSSMHYVEKPSELPEFYIDTPEGQKSLIDRYRQHMESQKLTSLRESYNEMLPDVAMEWAEDVARTGISDDIRLQAIPAPLRPLAAEYAQVIKESSDAGVLTQSLHTFLKGMVDIPVDGAQYIASRVPYAYYAIGSKVGSEESRKEHQVMLESLQEVFADKRAVSIAEATKYEKRDEWYKQGGLVVAESLPYMLYAGLSGGSTFGLAVGAVTVGSYAKDTEDTLLSIKDESGNSKMSPEEAALWAIPVGALRFFTERINNVTKLNPVRKKMLTDGMQRTLKQWAGGMAKSGIHTITTETAEEWADVLLTNLPSYIRGNISEAEIAGILAETTEQMVKAGPFLAALGEVAPTGREALARMGFGKSDIKATQLYQASEQYRELKKKDNAMSDFNDFLDNIDDGATKQDISDALKDVGISEAFLEPYSDAIADLKNREKAEVERNRAKHTKNRVKVESFRVAGDEKTEKAVQEIAKDLGFEIEIMPVGEAVVDENGQMVNAVMKDGKISVSSIVDQNPRLVVAEEAFHGMSKQARIGSKEWNKFRELAGPWIEEFNIEEDYANEAYVTKLEEAVAKKYAQFKTEEVSLLKRVFRWIKRIVGINSELELNTARDLFRVIEQREAADTGRMDKSPVDPGDGVDVHLSNTDTDAFIEEQVLVPEPMPQKDLTPLERQERDHNKFFDANGSFNDPRFPKVNPYEISDYVDALKTGNKELINQAFIQLKKQMVKWNKLAEETKDRRAGLFSRISTHNRSLMAFHLAADRVAAGRDVTGSDIEAMFPKGTVDGEAILNDVTSKISPDNASALNDILLEKRKELSGNRVRRQVRRQYNREKKKQRLDVTGRGLEAIGLTKSDLTSTSMLKSEETAFNEARDGKVSRKIDSLIQRVKDKTLINDVVSRINSLIDSRLETDSEKEQAKKTQAYYQAIRLQAGKVLRDVAKREVSRKNITDISKSIDKFMHKKKRDGLSAITKSFNTISDKIQNAAEKTTIQEQLAIADKKISKVATKTALNPKTEQSKRNIDWYKAVTLKAIQGALKWKARGDVDKAYELLNDLMDLQDPDIDDKKKESIEKNIYKLLPELKRLNLELGELQDQALMIAQTFTGWDARSQAEVADSMAALDNMIADAKESQILKINEHHRKMEKAAKAFQSGLNSLRGKFLGASTLVSGLATPWGFLKDSMQGLAEDSQERMDFYELVEKPFVNARDGYRGRSYNIHEKFNELKDTHYPDSTEYRENNKRREKYAKFSHLSSYTPTKWDIMNLVLMLENGDVAARVFKFKEARKAGKDVKDNGLIKQYDMLDDMRAELTKADREYINDMRDYLETDVLPEIQEKFRERFGSELDVSDMYFPLSPYNPKSGELSGSGAGVSLLHKFLQRRIPNTRELSANLDVNRVFLNHMDSVNRFLEYFDTKLIARDVLFSNESQKLLEETFGKKYRDRLTLSIKHELEGVSSKGPMSTTMRVLRKGIILSSMPFNFFSSARQIADFLSPGSEVPLSFYTHMIDTWFTPEGRQAMTEIYNHPSFKADVTMGGSPETVLQYKHGLFDSLPVPKAMTKAKVLLDESAVGRVLAYSRDIVKNTDAMSRWMAAPAVFRSVMETPEIMAIQDVDERRETARSYTVRILQENLQSPVQSDRPHIVRTGGTPSELLAIFTSALTPKIASEIQSLNKAIVQKDRAAILKLVKKLAVYHVVGGMLQWLVFWGVAAGAYEEEEDIPIRELWISIGLGPLAGAPLVGSMMEQTFNSALGKYQQNRAPTDMLMMTAKGLTKAGYQGLSKQEWEKASETARKTLIRATALGRFTDNILKKIDYED